MEGCHDTFHKIGLHSPIDHLDIPSSLFDDSEGMLISAVHKVDDHDALNLLIVDDRIPAGAKLY